MYSITNYVFILYDLLQLYTYYNNNIYKQDKRYKRAGLDLYVDRLYSSYICLFFKLLTVIWLKVSIYRAFIVIFFLIIILKLMDTLYFSQSNYISDILLFLSYFQNSFFYH